MSSTQRRELVAAVDRELHALPEIYRPVLRLALQPPGLRTAVLEAARLAAPAALTLPATVTTAHVMENLVLSIVALVAVAASTWMLWDGGVPPRDGRSAEVLEPAHPRATDSELPAGGGTSAAETADDPVTGRPSWSTTPPVRVAWRPTCGGRGTIRPGVFINRWAGRALAGATAVRGAKRPVAGG